MARIIVFKDKGPSYDKDVLKSICRCGLSKTYPYCSGFHISIIDEDDNSFYVYDSRGRRLGPVHRIVLESGEEIDPRDIYSQ